MCSIPSHLTVTTVPSFSPTHLPNTPPQTHPPAQSHHFHMHRQTPNTTTTQYIPLNKHHLIIKEHLIDTWTQIRKNTMCNNMHRTCEFVDHQILQHVDCIEHSLYYSPNYHPHNLIRLWLSCKGCQPTWHAYILWWCCLWNRVHVKHSPDEVMPSSYDSHHCKRDAAALQLGHRNGHLKKTRIATELGCNIHGQPITVPSELYWADSETNSQLTVSEYCTLPSVHHTKSPRHNLLLAS